MGGQGVGTGRDSVVAGQIDRSIVRYMALTLAVEEHLGEGVARASGHVKRGLTVDRGSWPGIAQKDRIAALEVQGLAQLELVTRDSDYRGLGHGLEDLHAFVVRAKHRIGEGPYPRVVVKDARP